MYSPRNIARIVGVLYIIGTVAGILSLVFGGAIVTGEDYLTEANANENQIILGTLFVLLMGLALAMIPVFMYPILKKENKTLALGYVVFRGALETIMYVLGIICWLLLLTLSHEFVAAGTPDNSYFQTLGNLVQEAMASIDHISAIIFSIGGIMFYYVLFQANLVPKWLSGWGLVSLVLVIAVGIAGMFGTDLMVLWAPLAIQEMVLALWLIFKGFNKSTLK